MMPTTTATITRDRHGQPLLVLHGTLFNGCEVHPAALRSLALQLQALADLAARQPGGKRWAPLRITLESIRPAAGDSSA